MAVFTAIATAIVGAFATAGTILGSTLLFDVVVGVVAAGLGAATAKLFGLYDAPGGDRRDPGIKIQLPPATDNKVPKLYGRNFTGSIIIDAEIKNQNKTMAYAMVISEYGTNDSWSVNDIYRGDAKLNFADSVVQSVTDPNSTSSTKVTGKLRCRVYAGGSSAANQIFPTSDAQNAYGTGVCQFGNWSASNTMNGLVFAIFEIDYEPEEGLTGLDAITFDITNALDEPSEVLLDYLQNTRYGAGLDIADIDTASFTDWQSFAQNPVAYLDTGGVQQNHVRYQIDGALSMFDSAKANIDKICRSGGAFFTYNSKQGKFGVVANRAATPTEQAAAFVFDDDNIVSSINIGSTELFSLFNEIEVEYPSVNQKDQTDVYYANVDASLRNPNEPNNKLEYRLEMCNDKARVSNLANVDLNQNRLNTVVDFTADFSAMQVDVGDVAKLTSPLYGWTDKLFRVMRLIEQENEEGVITVKVLLLEYDDDVYGDLLTQEDLPAGNTRINNWWVENSNASLTLGNILIVRDPEATSFPLYYPGNAQVESTLTITEMSNQFGSVYTGQTFVNIPIDVPANTNFNQAKVVCINETATTSVPSTFTQGPATAVDANSTFEGGTVFNFPIDTFTFNKATDIRFKVSLEDTISGTTSRVNSTAIFPGNVLARENVIDDQDMQPGAYGFHFIDVPPDTGFVSANSNITIKSTTAYYGYPTMVGDINYRSQAICAGGAPSGCYDCEWENRMELYFEFWYDEADYTGGQPPDVTKYDTFDDNWWAPEGRMLLTGKVNLTQQCAIWTYTLYGHNGFPLAAGPGQPEQREFTDIFVELIKIGPST